MTTALVLGGGGVAGVAWEIGLLHGLQQAGVDLTGADPIVGTSAGSVVGTLVATGVDLKDAAAAQRRPAGSRPPNAAPRTWDFTRIAEVFTTLADDSIEPVERRVRIGALALAAPTMPAEERHAYFAARLPHHGWPGDRRLLITGVDTATGERVVWDRESGADLVTAVAASCAVPAVYPPMPIDGRLYMDGGMYSGTNADLAAGARTIIVVAPMARISPLGAPTAELERLRQAGSEVLLIAPDDASMEAFGPNLLDPARREPSLAAGLAQGAALAGSAGLSPAGR